MADRSVVYRLKADVTQFKAQMASAAASVRDAGDKMTAADKNGAQFRKGLNSLGGAAGKVGLAAAAGLGLALVKAANFDQAMSNVSAATHESAANMELLRAAALKAGADTVFSATEAASGIEALSKAGVSTADVLKGGLRGALDLAAAGGQSVGDAAESAATAMTQFNLKGKDVPHIADLLAAGAGKAQGEVSDLSAALNQSGLVASQMGLSIEDTTGALAAFASAGLIGSDAGTAFKSMIQRLQNPLGQGAKAMEKYGIDAYDAQGNFVGITDVAGQLQSKLGGLSQAQRDAALAQIFGSDAVRAATVLYKQGESGIQGWIDKTNDQGYAADTAARKMDNLKGDLEQLGGSLETALIGTGSSSQGPLRSLVQSLTDVTNAYNKLPQGAQSAAAGVLGVTAAAGGGLFVFSKLVSGVAETREAMGQLGLNSGKAGSALSAVGRGATIAAAGLAGLAIIDAIQVGFGKAGPGIESVTKSLLSLNAASSLPDDLDGITASIERLADPNKAQALQDNISDALGGIGGGSELKEARGQIEALDAALAGLVTSAGPAAASDALANLASSADLSKGQLSDLKSLLPGYKEALDGADNSAKLGADAHNGLAGAAGNSSAALAKSAAAAKATAAAQAAARQAATETAQSFVGLGKSVNDSKVSLGGWIREMARNADALNNFTRNAQTAANKGLRQGLIKALQEAGPEGARRMAQLANATKREINAANGAWGKGQRAVRNYTNSVAGGAQTASQRIASMRAEIARIRSKTVHMDEKGAAAARARIAALKRAIDALRSKSVTITQTQVFNVRRNRAGANTIAADGDTVPKTGLPYADRHPYLLADGEEVTSNRYGQADRYRDVLKAINANSPRATVKAMLADGGTVGRLADGGTARSSSLPDLRHRLREFNAALAKSTKAIDREKAARDAIAAKRSELSGTVSGAFKTDLFGESNAWAAGGGVGGATGILKADIARANAFRSMLYQLRKKGLTGDALASIASTGDVGKAQALLSTGKSGIGQFQTLYNQRTAAANAVGSYAGSAAYGRQQAAANRILAQSYASHRRQEAAIKRLESAIDRQAKALGREINRRAGHAKRGKR